VVDESAAEFPRRLMFRPRQIAGNLDAVVLTDATVYYGCSQHCQIS
jgi:hypothetical protein